MRITRYGIFNYSLGVEEYYSNMVTLITFLEIVLLLNSEIEIKRILFNAFQLSIRIFNEIYLRIIY